MQERLTKDTPDSLKSKITELEEKQTAKPNYERKKKIKELKKRLSLLEMGAFTREEYK